MSMKLCYKFMSNFTKKFNIKFLKFLLTKNKKNVLLGLRKVIKMKQAMINYIKNEKNDELYTPEEAVIPILKYLNKNKVYWECTDYGKSNITKVLKENGFKVISTSKEQLDFLKDSPSFDFDFIITNPPYSLKDEFLEKCYSYKKGFLLLLPITALEGKKRNSMYRKYGLELIILDKRINFMKERKNVWFNTSWFCKGVCYNDLNFESIE